MIPIGDENPSKSTPLINFTLIITCFLIFLWQSMNGTTFFQWTIINFGFIPIKFIRLQAPYTVFTNIFLHGGWSHLIGNMLFLWIFGDNIEDRLGHIGYLIFYITCGVLASLFWMFTALTSSIPAVGASGAISGVLGAYYVLFPEARIKTIIGTGYFMRVTRIPAWIMIGLWFLYQLILGLFPINTGIAFWAHIGGFIVGFTIAQFIKSRVQTHRIPDEWY